MAVIVGITGSIASGKTYLTKILRNMGYLVIDLDIMGKNITLKDKNVKIKLVENFSEKILNSNGEINKTKLREIVFTEKKNIEILNKIVHPLLFQKLKKIIERISKNYPIIFIDGALIYEAGFDKLCDKIILVFCDKETQINRLIKRDKIDFNKAQEIINLQLDNEEKLKYADYVIDNTNNIDLNKLKKILNELLNLPS